MHDEDEEQQEHLRPCCGCGGGGRVEGRILNSHCFYLSVSTASASTPGQGSKASPHTHAA